MTDANSTTTSTIMTTSNEHVNEAQASIKRAASHKMTKAPKTRTKPSHPRTAEMVNDAIKTLKERGGSSLQAIKKCISATYKIDVEKQVPYIKKYLKTAVSEGSLIQPKGRGAAGSFKLSAGKSKSSRITKKSTSDGTQYKKVTTAVTNQMKKKSSKLTVSKKSPSKIATIKKRRATIKRPATKSSKANSANKVKVVPKLIQKRKMTAKRITLTARARSQANKKKMAKKE